MSAAAEQTKRVAREPTLVAVLEAIRDLEPEPFAFPEDWHEQIAGCEECRRWKDHPIQRGICDEHRRPLYQRDRHASDEEKRIGWRAKRIAREALENAAPDADAGSLPKVRIWSGEHRAWWRENRSGYTTDKKVAGVYGFEEAYESTWHCGPEKQISLQVVDAAIWVTMPDASLVFRAVQALEGPQDAQVRCREALSILRGDAP